MQPTALAVQWLVVAVAHQVAGATATGQSVLLARRRAGDVTTGGTLTQIVTEAETLGAASLPSHDLPSVSSLLGAASETLKSVNAKAAILEARAAQGQMEIEAKLARQKAVFEERLKKVAAENAQLAQQVHVVAVDNEKLRSRAQELMSGNDLMKTELRSLQTRVGAALSFVNGALQSSDDSQAPELDIVRPRRRLLSRVTAKTQVGTSFPASTSGASSLNHPRRPQSAATGGVVDDFSRGTQREGLLLRGAGPAFVQTFETVSRMMSGEALSRMTSSEALTIEPQIAEMATLEATRSGVRGDMGITNPAELLRILYQNVANLARQERASEASLESIFQGKMKALKLQQASLRTASEELPRTRLQLQGAVARLQDTQEQLKNNLHGVGTFLKHLTHFALAPAAEAAHLAHDLPETIPEGGPGVWAPRSTRTG